MIKPLPRLFFQRFIMAFKTMLLMLSLSISATALCGPAISKTSGKTGSPGISGLRTGNIYAVQNVVAVNSITAINSLTTNAGTVSYSVVFSSAVTGVTASNFTLTASNISGSSVGTPTSADNITWTVPVNTGTGSGALQLNLDNTTGMSDNVTTTLPFSGDTYTIDKNAPTVEGITAYSPSNTSPTNATSVTFGINFSEAVQNVDQLAFSLVLTGSVTTSGFSVSGSGAGYLVTVSGIGGNGTIQLGVRSGGTSITDAAGNGLSGGFSTGATYTITNTSVSINGISPFFPFPNPSNLGSFSFMVSYSGPVSGLSTNNFNVATTGTITGAGVTGLSTFGPGGNTWIVSVGTGSGDGTVQLQMVNGEGLSTAISNALPYGGGTYTVDRTPPYAVSIKAAAPGNSAPTNATSVTYTVTLSEAVQNIYPGYFSLATTGTASGTISDATGSGSTYQVTVSNITGNGTLRLDLNAYAVADLAYNYNSDGFTNGDVYTIQNPVTVNSIAAVNPTLSNSGTVNYSVVFSSAETGVTADNFSLVTSGSISGASVGTPTSADNITWTVPVNTGTGEGTLQLQLVNATGLSTAITSDLPFSGDTYTIDKTVPTVAITRADANPTNASSVTLNIKFSEPVTNVDAADFTLAVSGVGSYSEGAISGSGDTYSLTVSDITGTGTIGLNLNDGTDIKDAAGNTATAATGEVYNIDQSSPTAIAITATNPGNATPTNANSVDYTVTFSEPVTGVDGNDFIAVNTGTVSSGVISVSGSGDTYTVTVSGINGTGTLQLTLNDNGTGIQDAAGNAISGGFNTGDTYTIDHNPPILISNAYITNNGTNIVYARTGDVVTLSFGANETLRTPVVSLGGVAMSPVNIFGNVWNTTHQVTAGDPDGHYPFAFTMTDLAGNSAPEVSSATTGAYVTIDNTPPVPVVGNPMPSVTGVGGSVDFPVSYNEANFNNSFLSNSDITLNTTGTANASMISVSGSGNSYTVTVSGITGLGTIGINVGPGTATDLAANVAIASDPSPTVNVTVGTSTLKSLVLNPRVTLKQVGGPDYVDYTANIYGDASSVTVRPVTTDNNATVTVNGMPATSGVESAPVALNADTTAIAVTVTGPDGITKKTYRIALTRLPSNDALLKGLAFNPALGLTRITGANYADYTTIIYGNSLTSIKVRPTVEDSGATLTVNGVPSTSGVDSAPVALNADTTAIAVTVTAPDGATKKTYRIVITRVASNDALLKGLAFNPTLGLTRVSGTNYVDYTTILYGSARTIKVRPTTDDSGATLTINGIPSTPGVDSAPVTLNADTTAIAVTVTAADGVTKKTYRVVITRVPSNNATLTGLAFNPVLGLTHVSGPDYADYTATIYGNSLTSIKARATAADNGATLTVNGMPATSGVDSGPVALNADTTAIAVTVTAADGVTRKSYRVVITRVQSNDALLKSIVLTPRTTLTRVSGPDFADYTASVANATGSLMVRSVLDDNAASFTINGTAAISGVDSAPVTLNRDTTTIVITVTAADGVTRKSYVVRINKLPPPSSVMAYQQPAEMPVTPEAIVVHQNVSPNGDGNSDALKIDGITNYPDNKLQIMSRAGNLVYEVKGYDNTNKVFDGHSNDGKLQQAGTYFYSLEYKVGNETRHKTGYIVLKY